LIPNPSFEDHSGCPTTYSQLFMADTWLQATDATSDYFIGGATCPESSWNFGALQLPQGASDGDAFVGAINSNHQGDNNYIEYIGACLKIPLSKGVAYTLTMDMSAAPAGHFSGPTNGDTELMCIPTCSAFPIKGLGWMGGTYPVLARASPGGGTTGVGVWKALTFAFTPTSNCPAVMFGPSDTATISNGRGTYTVYDALNLQSGAAGACDAEGECVPEDKSTVVFVYWVHSRKEALIGLPFF
jgi:hypothetical protein